MSLKSTAKKSLIWTSINQFGVQIVNFFVLIILTRLLSPNEIGLIALISIFIGIGNMLINGGLSQSLLRTQNPTNEDYSSVFYFNLIIGVIVYLIIYFLAPFIALFYKSNILEILIRTYCIIFIINSITNVQIAKMTIDLDFKAQAFIALPGTIVSGLIGIILASNGFGVWSLIWPQIFLSFYTAVSILIYTKWVPKLNINLKHLYPHWKFGNKLMLAGLLDTIYMNLYSPLVGKFFGINQAGLYYRADNIKQFPLSNLSNILNKIAYPLLTPLQEDQVLFKKIVKKILKLTAFFLFPLIIILAVLAEPIFRFLFTEKWVASVKYYQLMSAAALIYPIHIINLTVLNIKGHSNKYFKIQILKTIISTITVLIFIKWGIIWLIIGLNIESIVAFFINTFYTSRLIGYNFMEQIKDLIPVFLVSVTSGAVAFLVNYLLFINNNSDLIKILFSGFVSIVTYLFFTYIFMKTFFYEILDFFLHKKQL